MFRFESLDGWRGVAAVLVALYHFAFLNHLYDWSFLRNSYLFVDFFFVLSGFVITHAYQNKLTNIHQLKKFILRRMARLLPLHWFVLLLFVVLELIKLFLFQFSDWNADAKPFTGDYSLPSLFSNIFLTHSLGIHDHLSWNYPSWSISVEFYTYIVFAVVGLCSFYFNSLKIVLYFSLIAISFYLVFINVDYLNEATYHFGMFRCVVGFFLGSLCYRYFKKTSEREFKNATAIEVLLIMFLYVFVVYFGEEKLSILAPFFFALIVYIFAFEQGSISKLLKIKALQNLGKWSYSIYMLHALIILIIGRVFNLFEFLTKIPLTINHKTNINESVELFYFMNTFFMDLITMIYLIVLFYLSKLTYEYIEKKGDIFFKSWFSKKNFSY